MPDLPRTPRTTHRRLAKRGSHDVALIHAILDEALVCHVGFVADGQPYVLPTTYARMGDRLVLHGSPSNRMLRVLVSGAPACITVSLLDGLVLARSAFHHSMNYRSVVVLGSGRAVEGREAKRAALEAIVEHVAPGRIRQARPPTDREVDGTLVVEFPVVEASAKVRAGPPVDEAEDLALDVWAGVVPLRLVAGEPVPDAHVPGGRVAPAVERRG